MQSKDKKYRIGSLVAGALLVVIIGIVFVRFSDDQAITDTGRNSAIKPLESGSPAAGGPGQDIEPPTENANLQTMFAAEQAAAETEPVPETMTALAELMDEVQALRAEVRALNDKIDRLSAPPEQKPGPDRPERVAATAALSRGRYVVQRGDTLSGIAERHDLRTGCLIAWNNIPRPDEIQAGRRLSLNGDADCIPFQEWIKATRIPSSEIARSGQSAGQTKPAPAAAGGGGWEIMGMGLDAVIMTRDGGVTLSFFRIDDEVPGAGRILKLDYRARSVQTTNGRIDRLF